jgi:hypothetical protein
VGGFNHFKYAMTKCTEICTTVASEPDGKVE